LSVCWSIAVATEAPALNLCIVRCCRTAYCLAVKIAVVA
jgi:hypothetical protein